MPSSCGSDSIYSRSVGWSRCCSGTLEKTGSCGEVGGFICTPSISSLPSARVIFVCLVSPTSTVIVETIGDSTFSSGFISSTGGVTCSSATAVVSSSAGRVLYASTTFSTDAITSGSIFVFLRIFSRVASI